MKAFMGLITALSFPLMLLNVLGGIVSGIWLAVLRDWHQLGIGVVFFFLSTWLLGFALMPSVLLAVPAAHFAEKGKMLGVVFFGSLSSIYVLALITLWCCGVLFLFMSSAKTADFIPRLIWSYGIATGPWGYMASKSQDTSGKDFGQTFAVFLAELAYLVLMVIIVFLSINLLLALKIFGGFMLVALVVQVAMLVFIQRARFGEEGGFGE